MNATYGRKRLIRWGAGVTLAGFLAGGGIALAATSGSTAGAAGAGTQASTGGAAGAGAQAAQQAATLNSALGAAASTTTPAPRVRWALGRLRRLGGVEGTVTFRGKTGFRTIAFERGTIESVGHGGLVVVKSPDGTTWTWRVVSDTVVRKNGAKTTPGALAAGEPVFAAGPIVSGNRDARLIVIKTGSESAQTSLS
jgi:hypothetical protein